jgi:diguanylate cyclase (GGDEF)-like protein
MSKSLLPSLLQLLLGTDPRQRRSLGRFFMSAAVYAFSLLMQWRVAGWVEFVPPPLETAFMVVLGAVVVGFYAVLRSPLSKRFADPALTAPQMVFAVLALAGAYLINPPLRGMLLMIVALVLVFGAFTLSPKACRRLGFFAVTVLGAAMLAGSLLAPYLFLPQVEALHFVFSAFVLPIIGLLAGQLSRMRANLRQQKIELKEALERIRLLATRDELTGLPNRRHAQALLDQEAARAQRERVPACLCLIDIDHFKRVNDTHGHAAGDEVLRQFARHAETMLRDTDVLARWGGEEFLLLLPDTRPEDALRVVERLRQSVSDPGTWQARPELQVTFSGGITIHREGEAIDDAVARADSVLYEAKAAGRDRVLLAA